MASHMMISFLAVGLLLVAYLRLSEAQIGVFYGAQGDNLPSAEDIVGLVEANNISTLRLLEPNKDILTALKGKSIDVLLGFPNQEIIDTAKSPALAEQWVSRNVKPNVPDVKIKYIVVGNEISRNSDANNYSFSSVPLMESIQTALQKQGIKDIKVTTSVDRSILQQLDANPPPSTATMYPDSGEYLKSILDFLSKNGAPLLANMSPYYELVKYPDQIKPEYVLFTSPDNVLIDGKLGYQNKFDAMLDAFHTVVEKAGFPEKEIVVSETGWPSAGGLEASIENEKTYITNLVEHVNKGTPKRPNKPVRVFLNLVDENQRGQPSIEKHFGVFTADGKPKFPLKFNPSTSA